MSTVTRRILGGLAGTAGAVIIAATPASATAASTDFYSGIGSSPSAARQAALSDAIADGYAPGDCRALGAEPLGHGRWEASISCTR